MRVLRGEKIVHFLVVDLQHGDHHRIGRLVGSTKHDESRDTSILRDVLEDPVDDSWDETTQLAQHHLRRALGAHCESLPRARLAVCNDSTVEA